MAKTRPSRLRYFSKEGGVFNEQSQLWEWGNERGEVHRGGDLPAQISPSGKYRAWFTNGVLNRDHGPALVIYDDSGDLSYTEWRFNGKTHRLDGPAIDWYSDCTRYFVNGVEFENGDTNEYKEACRLFRIEHGLLEPGKLTKPAHTATTPNASPTI